MVYLGRTKVKDMFIDAKPELFKLARDYRKNPTEAEKVLWEHLRIFRNDGFVFRRQHPVVFFVADFYCHRIKLVIEVDGGIHNDPRVQEYDENRSGELERYGITVIRFKNEEIINNLVQVLSRIRLYISELSSPSHPGGGG
jgi:very-short-patch-repair endonuclease